MSFMIKIFLIVCVCVLTINCDESQPKSRISDDQLNYALNDDRYLKRQLKCALGEAPCDPVGRRLKSLAPLVLRGSCPQCSAEEIKQIKTVLAHVQRVHPKEWSKIVKQYAGL